MSLWYHGTLAQHRSSIQARGLLPPSPRRGVYLTPSRDVALYYAEVRVQGHRHTHLKEATRRTKEDIKASELPADELWKLAARRQAKADEYANACSGLLIAVDIPESYVDAPGDDDGIEGVEFMGAIPSAWITSVEDVPVGPLTESLHPLVHARARRVFMEREPA